MKTATIFDIVRASFVDGPGIRTTVFFKGCNLRCAWCHNPESHSPNPELLIYKAKCTDCGICLSVCPSPDACMFCGKCVLHCPSDARRLAGRSMSVSDVWDEVRADLPFYLSSGGGVTFSGGECMMQADFLADLIPLLQREGIHTAIDTAGHVPFSSFERFLNRVDLILYDLKCMDNEKHKQYVGVENTRILENLARLLDCGQPIWIRIPLIPGVNDTFEEMDTIAAFLSAHTPPKRIELLPYHAMGEHKYAALGRELHTFHTPNKEAVLALKNRLKSQLPSVDIV